MSNTPDHAVSPAPVHTGAADFQWAIRPYTIITDRHQGVFGSETVHGFMHYSHRWAIHNARDRYHLTHVPSGKRVMHHLELPFLQRIIPALEALPIQWSSPEPTVDLYHSEIYAILYP